MTIALTKRYWYVPVIFLMALAIGILLAMNHAKDYDGKMKDQNSVAKDSTIHFMNTVVSQYEAERGVLVETAKQLRKDSSGLYADLQAEKKKGEKIEYIASMRARVIDSFRAASKWIPDSTDTGIIHHGTIQWSIKDSGEQVQGSTALTITTGKTLQVLVDSTIGTFSLTTGLVMALKYDKAGILRQTARATNTHVQIGTIEGDVIDPKLFIGTTPTLSFLKRHEYGIIITAVAAGEAFAIYELLSRK